MFDLGPTGHPGLYLPPLGVKGKLPFQHLHKIRPFRSGSNQAHLPLKDVNKLGDFIQSPPSQSSPEFRHPGIVFVRPKRVSVLLSLPWNRTYNPALALTDLEFGRTESDGIEDSPVSWLDLC